MNPSSNNNVNPNFGLNIDDYNNTLYHSSANNNYSSYSPTGLLQTSYSVGSYGVPHPDHMRFYPSPLKHDYGYVMSININ